MESIGEEMRKERREGVIILSEEFIYASMAGGGERKRGKIKEKKLGTNE